MRMIKTSNFHIFFNNKFVECIYSNDEYWSTYSSSDIDGYPIAIVLSGDNQYLWTDRVI